MKDEKKSGERGESGCHHKFDNGKCIHCGKTLAEIFVEETSKDSESCGC